MHQSLATIDSPEFINLQPLDINPLMSSCEIKVLYLNENRNRSYITKEVATEMAKTLRGAPIVGYYKKDKEDFRNHGERVIMDDEGIKFDCLTVPYGFVSPDAKVWFQKFDDYDDFGNAIQREYLMTTGFLWTGQFPECKCAIEGEGRPHSMELDGETLSGKWSENIKEEMEFFIINDAVFSKLCILGEDVEPCFEGSSITAPKISSTFNLDDNFKQTLFSMMRDLKFALEGGQDKMTDLETSLDISNKTNEIKNEMFTEGEIKTSEEASTEFAEDKKSEDKVDEKESETDKDKNFVKDDEEEEEKKGEEASEKDDNDTDEEDKKEKKFSLEEYSALENELASLKSDYDTLNTKYAALVEFKNGIESEKKDALINSFYMLSDEDKKDVIENKAQYSLDDIEAKLSILCVRKKVNFNLDEKEDEEKVVTSFSFDSQDSSLPDWIKAVKEHM